MKTGGTLNFLKRAGAMFLLIAVFASSCNKYADDFKQLNTKLDALAAQVAGVTQLSTDMTAVKASLTAIQTAVAALPQTSAITGLSTSLTTLTNNLAALATKVDNINTTLTSVANAGTATKAVVDQLTKDLAALNTKVTNDDKAIADQLTALTTGQGTLTAGQTAIKDQLTALQTANTALKDQLTQVQTALAGLAQTGSGSDATALTIRGLQLMLQAQKLELDQLLANSNMYNGDVVITSGPELTFWTKKVAQLGMINGNLVVKTANLASNLDSVNFVTKNIAAVIGTQGTVKNSVTIVSTSTTTVLDLSHLVSVAGDYSVTGVKVNDSNLSSVGGNFLVNFDGPYAYPNLSTVSGNLTLTKVASSTTAPVKAGTTSISLPKVAVTGSVFDGVNLASVLNYPDATSIVLSGGVTSLTAAKATSIVLGSTDYTSGLTVQAPTAAAVVDLSAATGSATTGAINVTTGNGGSVLLTKLTKAPAGVLINTGTSGTVDFTALASAAGGVGLTGPATVSFPALVSGSVSSDATTVTMAKHAAAAADVIALPNVTTLTMGAIANPFNLTAYPTLVTASITGKTITTNPMPAGALGAVTTGAANNVLATVTLGGTLESATLDGLVKLASVTTSGVINKFTLNNCAIITGVTLAHNYYVGGPGSELIVTSNPKLTSLSSGVLDYPKTITVTGNALLTSLNLSSYVTKLFAAPGAITTVTINSNKLGGNYTNAQAIQPTSPYIETTITSADLKTLKAFVASYPSTTPPTLVLAVNLDKVTLAGGTTTATLSARMTADTGHTPAFAAPGTGITTAAEFALVQ